MKPKHGVYIALVILVIIGLANGCKKDDKNEKQLEVLRQRFDSLSNVINDYKDTLKKYDEAIVELKLRDSELSGKLEYNKTLQTQIKKEYAKTNRFTNYQSNDITRYFADSLDN